MSRSIIGAWFGAYHKHDGESTEDNPSVLDCGFIQNKNGIMCDVSRDNTEGESTKGEGSLQQL